MTGPSTGPGPDAAPDAVPGAGPDSAPEVVPAPAPAPAVDVPAPVLQVRRRSRRGRAGAAVSAVLAAGAVAAVLTGAQLAPLPSAGAPTSALGDAVTPATDVLLACAGPAETSAAASTDASQEGAATPASSAAGVLSLPDRWTSPPEDGAGTDDGTDGADEGVADAAAPTLVLSALTARDGDAVSAAAAAPGDPVTGSLLTPDGGFLAAAGGAVARGAVATPVAGAEPLVAGTSLSRADEGDLRGLATAPCTAPRGDAWLVGGSTEVGDSARLVVANPGTTTATAQVTVLVGTSAADGTTPVVLDSPELSVAPGQQRSVLLEGLAPGAGQVAVHVETTGAPVSSWVVTTALEGLTPGGTDVVTPGAAPATQQVVPGITVADGEADPVLRLAAPGDGAVVARWQLYGPEGPVLDATTALAATVPGGSVLDVPLSGLAPGDYTAVVDADAEVVAAVGLSTSRDAAVAGDRAWSAAAEDASGVALVALPQAASDAAALEGVSTQLLLRAPVAADGSAPAQVGIAVVDADGGTAGARDLAPVAGETVTVDVTQLVADAASGDPLALVVTSPEGSGLVAAVRSQAPATSGGRLLSVHAVPPPAARAGDFAVTLTGAP